MIGKSLNTIQEEEGVSFVMKLISTLLLALELLVFMISGLEPLMVGGLLSAALKRFEAGPHAFFLKWGALLTWGGIFDWTLVAAVAVAEALLNSSKGREVVGRVNDWVSR